MAVDYKRRGRRKKKRKPVPGWLWLVTGTGTGLFIAFLANISQPDSPENVTDKKPVPDTRSMEADVEPTLPPKPRFDFYTLLPEMEVVIPDRPAESFDSSPANEPSPRSAPSRSAPPLPEPESSSPGTSFLLQVGSFRQDAEADSLRAKLMLTGFDAHIVSSRVNDERWNRVRLGPYATLRAANQIMALLRERDFDALVLKVK